MFQGGHRPGEMTAKNAENMPGSAVLSTVTVTGAGPAAAILRASIREADSLMRRCRCLRLLFLLYISVSVRLSQSLKICGDPKVIFYPMLTGISKRLISFPIKPEGKTDKERIPLF